MTPKVFHVVESSRKPITVFYSGRGVAPSRTITYRKITPVKGMPLAGKVKIAKSWHYVIFTRGAWELVSPIDPITYTLMTRRGGKSS